MNQFSKRNTSLFFFWYIVGKINQFVKQRAQHRGRGLTKKWLDWVCTKAQRQLEVAILDWKHGSIIGPSGLFRGHMSLTLFHMKHFISRTQWLEMFLISTHVERKKKKKKHMEYPSLNPTLATHLGTTYTTSLQQNTVNILFLVTHTTHFGLAPHRHTDALFITLTPCAANANSKVILTNHGSQCSALRSAFFVPNCWQASKAERPWQRKEGV